MKKLLEYLTLGVIVNPLPFNISNGQTIDAIPVMADFNWIISQVNLNAPTASIAALALPSGSSLVGFIQSGIGADCQGDFR